MKQRDFAGAALRRFAMGESTTLAVPDTVGRGSVDPCNARPVPKGPLSLWLCPGLEVGLPG
jgi:hypothetical protein